jgi:hypothetical protein
MTKRKTIKDEQAPVTDDKRRAASRARTALRPSVNAALVVTAYSREFGEHDIATLTTELSLAIGRVVDSGDRRGMEEMLAGQASALQAIFVNFAGRAANAQYIPQMEAYLRLAMKAQNQCRMTLETLAAIKNPPVVYARQANIANGPQQVNNGVVPTAPTFANTQNEQLEAQHGERLDFGTAGQAGNGDPAVATVGAVYRAEDR